VEDVNNHHHHHRHSTDFTASLYKNMTPTATPTSSFSIDTVVPTIPHPNNAHYQYTQLSIPKVCPHITIVALHRPSKRNALNATAWKEIGSVFASIGRGDGCRCVLLCGDGLAFCAGIDVTDASFFPTSSDSDNTIDVARKGITFVPQLRQMQDCFSALETDCPVPIVAAVHGMCIGAGIDLITAADIRWCSPDAVFSVREVAIGLAADVGTLQRLPKVTGHDSWVREVCYTGRDISAHEAYQHGLVSRVTDTLWQDALDLCCTIAQRSPVAVQGTKHALVYARDHSVAEGLDQIAWYNALALQSPDLAMAVMARLSKTKPQFPDMPPYSKL
jgi:Delta3,5-Delta2,4-dienoyl-CoA isomerase